MCRILPFVFVLGIISFSNLWALVDYTEQEFSPQNNQQSPKINSQTTTIPSKSAGGSFISAFALSNSYEMQKMNMNNQTIKADRYLFNLFVQSDYNFFIMANHWMMKSDDKMISTNSSTQNGNPTGRLGFNWLRFGGQNDLATVDLTAGMMFKGNSDFASSRNDQIVGIETTKRFYELVFGVGYEYRITGDPSDADEIPLGNVGRFQVALGWKVSSDINLSLEANYIKVQSSGLNQNDSLLSKGFTYSYLTPKLSLALSKYVGLDLGGNFRTKKIMIDDSIINARMWDMQGIFGNSIFTGLNILL